MRFVDSSKMSVVPYVQSRSPLIERRSTSSMYQIATSTASRQSATKVGGGATATGGYIEGPYTLTRRAPRQKSHPDHDHLTVDALQHLASVCPLCAVVRDQIVPRVRVTKTVTVWHVWTHEFIIFLEESIKSPFSFFFNQKSVFIVHDRKLAQILALILSHLWNLLKHILSSYWTSFPLLGVRSATDAVLLNRLISNF